MRTYRSLLSCLPLFLAGSLAASDDETVTVTLTRTFTTCPWTAVTTCEASPLQTLTSSTEITSSGTATSVSTQTFSLRTSVEGSVTLSTTPSLSSASGTSTPSTTVSSSSSTTTTTSLSSLITTSPVLTTTSSSLSTSTSTSASSPTSSVPGTVSNPGQNFLPSAQISTGPGKLAKRSTTVYIDMSNPNAGAITTDETKAVQFSIDSNGFLDTTLNDYPYVCGSSPAPGSTAPSVFYCDDSGAVPLAAKGWTNSPTFSYKDWTFCYTSNMMLYLSKNGPTSDCTAITFTADFTGST